MKRKQEMGRFFNDTHHLNLYQVVFITLFHRDIICPSPQTTLKCVLLNHHIEFNLFIYLFIFYVDYNFSVRLNEFKVCGHGGLIKINSKLYLTKMAAFSLYNYYSMLCDYKYVCFYICFKSILK